MRTPRSQQQQDAPPPKARKGEDIVYLYPSDIAWWSKNGVKSMIDLNEQVRKVLKRGKEILRVWWYKSGTFYIETKGTV